MCPRFASVLGQLPSPLQTAVSDWLDDDFPAMLSAAQVTSLCEQTGLARDALALALLPLASACARHIDISRFAVGAIALGRGGDFYFGANMEFPGVAIGQTLHAEQSAISHAWMRGETGIQAIYVNHTPCGHCRQFMNELNSGLALQIILPAKASATLADLLPQAFGPDDLGVAQRIFDQQDHGLISRHRDKLAQRAIAAANRSHAPYSHALSGVAIETCQGDIYCGSYAENAAFNPSLPPLQVALNLLILNGREYHDIQRVMLAEIPNASVRQWQGSVALLNILGCQHVEQVGING